MALAEDFPILDYQGANRYFSQFSSSAGLLQGELHPCSVVSHGFGRHKSCAFAILDVFSKDSELASLILQEQLFFLLKVSQPQPVYSSLN